MATYIMDFNNNAGRTWTMAVYQTIPTSVGLDSVSWKQSTAPDGGSTGVEWNLSYTVNLANYRQKDGKGVYRASQTLGADLGTAWEIQFKDNVQQLIRKGTTAPGQISILNSSNDLANPGIGMSGAPSIYQHDVNGGATALFTVKPTYWVALFNSVTLGQVISTDVSVGPLMITFPSGQTSATLDAELDGKNIVLTISYGPGGATSFFAMDSDQVQARIDAQEEGHALVAAAAASLSDGSSRRR